MGQISSAPAIARNRLGRVPGSSFCIEHNFKLRVEGSPTRIRASSPELISDNETTPFALL